MLYRRLQLRGGAVPELVVPDAYAKLEQAMSVLNDDKTITEGRVTFRAGNHSIGTTNCNNMGVALDRADFTLRVLGEGANTTNLAGCWRCEAGSGELEHARLLDVELLADHDYDGEFLHPGIMYGDCCIVVTSPLPWVL